MCGKRLTFLYTSPCEHVDFCITFQVLSLSTFAFNECSDIIIFTIIFVVKSSKGFCLNNVGPASQTVDQHYISIGLSIVLSGVSDDWILSHQHDAEVRKDGTITQCCFNDRPASTTVGQH